MTIAPVSAEGFVEIHEDFYSDCMDNLRKFVPNHAEMGRVQFVGSHPETLVQKPQTFYAIADEITYELHYRYEEDFMDMLQR